MPPGIKYAKLLPLIMNSDRRIKLFFFAGCRTFCGVLIAQLSLKELPLVLNAGRSKQTHADLLSSHQLILCCGLCPPPTYALNTGEEAANVNRKISFQVAWKTQHRV